MGDNQDSVLVAQNTDDESSIHQIKTEVNNFCSFVISLSHSFVAFQALTLLYVDLEVRIVGT